MPPLRHLPIHPVQVVTPLSGEWRGGPDGAQPPPTSLSDSEGLCRPGDAHPIYRSAETGVSGVKQLRYELIRRHDLTLSFDTIHRTLVRHREQVLKRPRRWRKGERRYSRPVPGGCVQRDVSKFRPGVYQYTAIGDCSPYKVLGVYSRPRASTHSTF